MSHQRSCGIILFKQFFVWTIKINERNIIIKELDFMIHVNVKILPDCLEQCYAIYQQKEHF